MCDPLAITGHISALYRDEFQDEVLHKSTFFTFNLHSTEVLKIFPLIILQPLQVTRAVYRNGGFITIQIRQSIIHRKQHNQNSDPNLLDRHTVHQWMLQASFCRSLEYPVHAREDCRAESTGTCIRATPGHLAGFVLIQKKTGKKPGPKQANFDVIFHSNKAVSYTHLTLPTNREV